MERLGGQPQRAIGSALAGQQVNGSSDDTNPVDQPAATEEPVDDNDEMDETVPAAVASLAGMLVEEAGSMVASASTVLHTLEDALETAMHPHHADGHTVPAADLEAEVQALLALDAIVSAIEEEEAEQLQEQMMLAMTECMAAEELSEHQGAADAADVQQSAIPTAAEKEKEAFLNTQAQHTLDAAMAMIDREEEESTARLQRPIPPAADEHPAAQVAPCIAQPEVEQETQQHHVEEAALDAMRLKQADTEDAATETVVPQLLEQEAEHVLAEEEQSPAEVATAAPPTHAEPPSLQSNTAEETKDEQLSSRAQEVLTAALQEAAVLALRGLLLLLIIVLRIVHVLSVAGVWTAGLLGKLWASIRRTM